MTDDQPPGLTLMNSNERLPIGPVVFREMNISIKRYAFLSSVLFLVLLSGCGSFVDQTPATPTTAPSPTATTQTTVSAYTPTQTESTPPSTATKTRSFTKEQKYGYFRDGYIEGIQNGGVNVVNNSLDPENDTLHVTYKMRDPKSDLYTGRERENVSLSYVAVVDFYLNGNISELDETWIPKQINVTAVTPDGRLYETAYTTFERAQKMINGEISAKRYLLEYYGTIEMGPANPEYEG